MRCNILTEAARGALLLVGLCCGCISQDSEILKAGEGCQELNTGGVTQEGTLDATVEEMVQAAIDLNGVADKLTSEAQHGCALIATELGAQDTWSSIQDSKKRLFNGDGTGACNAAAVKLDALMRQAAAKGTTFALALHEGACHLDFKAQAQCDAKCDEQRACDPGRVETRCAPGELAVVCSGACQAGAFCEGTSALPANCMGKCESECVGACKGTCYHRDGRVTEGDPNCHGKCSSSCNGKCKGLCKIDESAGIDCGASVRCKAGCTANFTDPVCESTFLPPNCTVNNECHATCSATVAANPICDPPSVMLCISNSTPEIDQLRTTVEKNLPRLIAIGKRQGKLAEDALQRLGAAAQKISERSGSFNGHSLACAAASSKVTIEAAASLAVTIEGTAKVRTACESNAR